MHHYQDPKIMCPFDNQHIMPSLTYTFHYLKCEQKFKMAHPDKVVLHCPNNYMHIFFSAETLAAHLPLCKSTHNTQTVDRFVPREKSKSKAVNRSDLDDKIKRSRSREESPKRG